MSNWTNIFPVISNLAFLAPGIRAIQYGRVGRAFIYFLVIFSSGSYHLCKSYSGACLFEYQSHKQFDFVIAQVNIPVGALYFIYFPLSLAWLEWWTLLISLLLTTLVVTCFSAGFYIQCIISAAFFLVIFIYWGIFYCLHGRIPKYKWKEVMLGVAVSIIGLSMFQLQNVWPAGYWALHSLWHILIAFGQFFLIGIRKMIDIRYSVASKIDDDVINERNDIEVGSVTIFTEKENPCISKRHLLWKEENKRNIPFEETDITGTVVTNQ